MQAGFPIDKQRVRLQSERPRAQYQVCAPPPAPVTMESLRDVLLVQNDVLRYIMERQHIEAPDWFMPPQQGQAAGGDEVAGGDEQMENWQSLLADVHGSRHERLGGFL
ncbi:hypothetical protein HanPSC8_Chr16g0718071 [Helianthus annuus]|nr:hypothetical protein HanPSC8_Chr16g0718071 [Helianthus annuus]